GPAERLWAVVLLLAVKDGASRVWYDPARGDRRLGYEIRGREYAMVPPPLSMQALLPLAIRNLSRGRSTFGFMGRLFGRRADLPTTVEAAFMASVGGHGITVSAALDPEWRSVILRLSADAQAALPARDALEAIVTKHRFSSRAEPG